MGSGGTQHDLASARALDKAVRRHWRDWHQLTLKARRDPGSRRLVHRFRIATRRLLAVEDLLAAASLGAPVHDRLDAVFRAAGRIRDLQICRTELATLDERNDAVRALERSTRKRLPVLVQRLDHELRALRPKQLRQAVRRLRARLQTAAKSPAARRARARVLAAALLRLREARRQLDRFARGLGPDSDDASLHSLRLRLKGVRYMTELLACLADKDAGPAPAFDTWQHALGAITDRRAVLREIDRCRVHRGAPEAELASLRRLLLHDEHRRIRALFGRASGSQAAAAQLRLLRTAPLA